MVNKESIESIISRLNNDALEIRDDTNNLLIKLNAFIDEHKTQRLLSEIFEKDSSIGQLANMPCGYFAQRTDIESDWVTKRKTRSDISH